MFLPGSTRLFCTSHFYVLAKTREALLEIPLKNDIYQLEEDPNLQHFDEEFEKVPGDLDLYGLNSLSIVCPEIFFFQCFLKVKNVTPNSTFRLQFLLHLRFTNFLCLYGFQVHV